MIRGKSKKKNKHHNVAILISSLNRGGAERVASLLSRYFYERDYRVYLFVNKLNREMSYPYCGKVIEIPKEEYKELLIFNNKTAKLISLEQKANAIRKLKKKYHINYSISFMDEYNLLNVMSKYKDKTYLRICDVMSVSGVAKENGWDFAPRIIGHYYNRATRVIVVNEAERTDLVENYYVRPEKIHKIINPIRSVEFISTEKKWEFGDFTVVCIGRIIKGKQQHHLVRAFSKVLEDCPRARLIFVGNGESKYFQYVRQLTMDMNLSDAVDFQGQQTDVGFYLRNGQVFALASYSEGYPNSMLEALTIGIPVVAVDGIGGVGEILNDNGDYEHPKDEIMECSYGILTPRLDGKHYSADMPLTKEEDLLAKGIAAMLLDDNLKKKYQGVAAEFVKANDMESVGKEWEKMFHDKKKH